MKKPGCLTCQGPPQSQKFLGFMNCFLHVVPQCSSYHYCTTSFQKAWTQVLRKFKSWLQGVGHSQWWGSLTIVLVEIRLNAFCWSTIPQKQLIIIHHHQYKIYFRNTSVVLLTCPMRFMLLTHYAICTGDPQKYLQPFHILFM